ncbi:restriction endonuclease subunit S [Tenacibaculum aiptasiae]|uniref:restriction endonuclease subunit S n=1 Tax=Tenacibaculum aiptasiae TaxID=426481 RepID=UPI00232B6147|nr:restriction endonuclease subunit S [Tenacibaculum aiptasiae]
MGKWEEKQVGECLVEIQTGKTPPKSKKIYYENPNTDWFSPSDFDDNIKELSNSKNKISIKAIEEGKAKIYPLNSLLLVGIGATIGKVGLLKFQASSNQQITALTFKEKIDPEFAYYWFRYLKEYIINMSSSATMPIINQKEIKKLPIKYPKSLPEQHRIVAKLDALFEKIDNAIALLEDNIEHTQALMGSVLDEELIGLNYKVSIWKIHKWKDVLTINNGKNQKQVENPNGQFPIYGSGGIMSYADDFLCEKDSVIIGRKGTINKPIYVDTKFWNVDTAFGLTPKNILLPRYLYFFCLHFDFLSLNKSTTLPSLAKRDLLEIEINLPPLDVQKKILEKLESVNNFKDRIVKNKTQKIENLKVLKSSLLDKAFKGEL